MSEARFPIHPPGTRDEIVAELERLDADIIDFFCDLEVDTLLRPQGEKWSPADHLRHLTKTLRAVRKGLRVPGPLLVLRFGLARRDSRSFEEMVEAYRARLAEGGVRAGKFAPSRPSDPSQGEAFRDRVLAYWRQAERELRETVADAGEGRLDRYFMPHPALGKLTQREMLYFALYHNAHHARLVAERLGGSG